MNTCPRLFAAVVFGFLSFFAARSRGTGAPAISTQPQSQSVRAGSNALFTVSATGQSPLAYQWSLNGTDLTNNAHLSGATGTNLVVNNVGAADAGSYQVIVSNSHGSATSSNATLTVLLPPAIDAEPANTATCFGGPASFSVSATGTAPLVYQWYFNGSALSDNAQVTGSAGAVLNLSGAQSSNIGNYQVIVTNSYGAATSTVVALTVTNAIHYVNAAATHPVPPYLDWSTAAATLQDAVDTAFPGDQVLVTNGTYNLGSRVTSATTNCVVVTNAISLSSVFGPALTLIDGGGDKRCLFLASGCQLSGFTVTNGATSENGGGIFCADTNVLITNCVVVGNSTYIQGGGVYQGTLINCVLTNNMAGGNAAGFPAGGGAGSSVLSHCLVTGNSGGDAGGGGLFNCVASQCVITNNITGSNAGGGAASSVLNNCLLIHNTGCGAGDNSTLNDCTLIGNTAPIYGGGANYSTLNRCTLVGNSAFIGGGAQNSTLYNCTLVSNSAGQSGGGASACTLSDCTLIGNLATNDYGGGVDQSTLFNCTLSGNVASRSGGGAYDSTLANCTLSNNVVADTGGGAANCALSNCLLVGNSAAQSSGGADSSVLQNSVVLSNTAPYWAGGVGNCSLTNCVLAGNSASNLYGIGGGANGGSLVNCLLTGNSAGYRGGAAEQSTLLNCTVAANSAGNDGGGVDTCWITNSIIVNNTAPLTGNYSGTNSMSWSCTAPLPDAGNGDAVVGVSNLSSAPLFVDAAAGNLRLYPGSPGIDAGNNDIVTPASDLDGHPRIVNGTVDLGAYEFQNSPFIEVQPAGQTVAVGQSPVTFSVVAAGPDLSYQWLFNGNGLPGATSSNLVLNNVQAGDSGTYSVWVTNSFGAILSSNAVLTVLYPPMITLEPTNQVVPQGSNVTFVTTVSGDAPLHCQWYYNGTPLVDGGQISGAGNTNLTIIALQFTNIGDYQLIVTNLVGSAASAAAALTVTGPPMLTAPFTNQVTMVFSDVTLALSATGTPSLYYQWQFNGAKLTDGGKISGSRGPNLTVADPQPADAGQYTVIVTNAYGSLTNTATLTVLPIYNWGYNVIIPPPTATNLIAIAVASFGFDNADFAVRADGTLLGWGNDFEFILDNLPTTTNFVSVTGADGNYIAITRTGTINTWGGTSAGPPYNLTNVVAAEVENAGAAALLQNGTIVPWPGSPPPPANATNIIALSVGSWGLGGFLAVRQDGTLIGWGDNAWGETAPPPQATNVVAVLCGDKQSIVLRADGTVVNFGTAASAPPPEATNVTAIALGTDNSLVLRQDGTVVEWGALGSAPSFITNVVAIAANGVQNMVLVQDPNATAPPQILQQPLGAVTRTNQTLILEGQAFGALPIRYQWYFNNAPIAGQTNRWLLLSPIQSAQGGNYQFVATNNFGSVTSLTAVVWTPPAITTPPSTTVAFGSNAVLDVVATGTGPLEYQWYFNGTPLSDGGNVSGSATAELTVADFQSANVGNYAVTVTNLAGAATGTAVINVLNPLVATQPQSQSVFAGATVNFSVTATGQSPLAYQWQFDGTNLPDATNALLVLSNVVVGQAGTYSIIITNSYGAIASSNATLAVTALAITSQPQNQSVLGGATASFAVTVNGQSPLAYQWLFNGTILSDATNNPLVLSNALVSESGTYSVIVTNAYGSIASSNATLTVTPLAITAQPTNRITWPNGSAIFKVNVSGAAPFNFEWQCNGVDVPGTWTNALTITNAQASQFGIYHVIVSNAYGSVTSSNAALLFSQVAVWGGNQGETNLPPGLTNIIAIAGCAPSTADCLALRSNGLAIHWPRTNYVAISNVVAIAGNGGQESYALLLKTNNVVYEWFLADDVTEFMGSFTNIAAIASFDYAPLALRTDGTLVAGNYYSTGGTGGIGTITNIVNAVAIAEGASHGLALKADGTVVAWGSNTYGQTNVPPGLTNAIAVAAGYYHSLALKSDGTLLAWGLNSYGQAQVPAGLSNVVAIAAGMYHSLALKADGTVVAWGSNAYGQTNVPPGLSNVIAIAAGQYDSLALIGNAPPSTQTILPNPTLGTNGFSLSLPTQSGKVYALEYKNSLADTNWTLLPLVPGGSGETLRDSAPTNSQRFYRVQQW